MKTNQIIRPAQNNRFLAAAREGLGKVAELIPTSLLSLSVEEVSFPTRFLNHARSANIATLADLRGTEFKSGANLGQRTYDVAAEELAKFMTKKLSQSNLVTLRSQMEDFASDLPAREARIWELRMGLLKEVATLEAVGGKYGLTRERVRQIEDALVKTFGKMYPAYKAISAVAKEGMTLNSLVMATGSLLKASDPLPVAAILQSLDPKMYLVHVDGTVPILSTSPQTEYTTNVRKTLSIAEDIFRNHETSLRHDDIVKKIFASEVDAATRASALEKIANEGIWEDNTLLSPNRDRANVAMGMLQILEEPILYSDLADEVSLRLNEPCKEEQLRAALSTLPLVRSFGGNLVGLPRMVPLSQENISAIISYCEGVVSRGALRFQWNVKDLFAKVLGHFDGLSLTHNHLNVILHESKKLAYLGRFTWMLKGAGEVERKLYRDIFVSVLEKSGKPLPEDTLIERCRHQRGIHLNAHLRNEVEVLEVSRNVWGLTRRDSPFSNAELNKLAKAFDNTYQSGEEFDSEYIAKHKLDTKGLKPTEVMKIIEVNS